MHPNGGSLPTGDKKVCLNVVKTVGGIPSSDSCCKVCLFNLMSEWYLLYTKPKHEDPVAKRLSDAGYEVLNPKLKERRFYRRRLQEMVSPLFPRYIFVKMEFARDYRIIKYTRGVTQVVGSCEAPVVVDESIVEAILSRINSDGIAVLSPPEFTPGQEIEIHKGPFAGLTGVFIKPMKGIERVSVLLKALDARVEIDTAYLSKPGVL